MAWLITDARVFGGKTTAPGVTDDENSGYRIGDFWIDETSDASYQLVDKTAGAAVWIVTSPELHAPLHRASEADDLLSVPGAIGGGTPAAGAFTTLSASGLISADGGQIAFPADQNASADANTLDDYEEGTWTPLIEFGGAAVEVIYAIQGGSYTKVGKRVILNGFLVLSSKGSSVGSAILTNLPFSCANGNDFYSPMLGRITGISFADFFEGYIPVNTATCLLEEITNAGVRTALTNTNFANNADIIFCISYDT